MGRERNGDLSERRVIYQREANQCLELLKQHSIRSADERYSIAINFSFGVTLQALIMPYLLSIVE